MIKQYPHTISITTQAQATRNGSGNWVPGSSSTVEKACRYEPRSGNGFIQDADGQRIYYDGIVYLPLPQTTLAPGVTVEIKNGAEVLSKSTVKRFSAGQLNARVWL
jgi:hypothetical protein